MYFNVRNAISDPGTFTKVHVIHIPNLTLNFSAKLRGLQVFPNKSWEGSNIDPRLFFNSWFFWFRPSFDLPMMTMVQQGLWGRGGGSDKLR
jgi:hypothetical protein